MAVQAHITRASVAHPTIQAAHAALIGRLAAIKPHKIVGNADAEDVRARTAHVGAILAPINEYVLAIAADTAADPISATDQRAIENSLLAFASEVVAAVTLATEGR
jgi:hypothetical protein